MANSLFQQLNTNQSPISSDILSMLQSAKQSNNPMQMLMNLANRNGAVANILREVQESGGDAKTLFYRKAQEMGVDPNSILSKLR